MKQDLVDLLCCPACKKFLTIKNKEEDKKEIKTGSLFCSKCKKEYKIKKGIPDLCPKK